MTIRRTVWICAVGVLALGSARAAEDLETQAKKIETLLMSPCCMTNTVAVHESGASHEMRREIREMLAAGRTEQEILDHYVERHGAQILAMPEARGFSLLPYVFPLFFVILSGWVLIVAMRRWRAAASPASSTADVEDVTPDAGYAERLRHDLEQYDS